MKTYSFNTPAGEVTVNQTRYAYKSKKWGDECYAFTFNITFDNVTTKGFTFYDCVANYRKGITQFSESLAKEAIECVLSECMIPNECRNAEEFCMDFGYTNPFDAMRIFNGIKRNKAKLNEAMNDETIPIVYDYFANL